MGNTYDHIFMVGDVLVSPDIINVKFCCDLDKCHGQCCIEGDAGAPVTLDETMEIENVLDTVWGDLSASGQAVIDKQGVAYTDEEGDLVTSIVGGKDCVFTCYENGCCLCALERSYRNGKTGFVKPISCSLYPVRVKDFGMVLVVLITITGASVLMQEKKGEELNLPLYKFLKEPLTRRFGKEWYDELCEVAEQLLG